MSEVLNHDIMNAMFHHITLDNNMFVEFVPHNNSWIVWVLNHRSEYHSSRFYVFTIQDLFIYIQFAGESIRVASIDWPDFVHKVADILRYHKHCYYSTLDFTSCSFNGETQKS